MLCQCWNNDNFIQEQKPESYLHLTLSAFHDRLAIYRKSNLPPPHLSAWWKSHKTAMYDARSLHYITGRISAMLSFTKDKSIQVAQFTAKAVFVWFFISDITYFMKSELWLWNFNDVIRDYPPLLAQSLHAEGDGRLPYYYSFTKPKWIYICTVCKGGST